MEIITSIVVAFVAMFIIIAGIMWREIHVQNAFERRVKEDWDSMSERERAESGMENMYC